MLHLPTVKLLRGRNDMPNPALAPVLYKVEHFSTLLRGLQCFSKLFRGFQPMYTQTTIKPSIVKSFFSYFPPVVSSRQKRLQINLLNGASVDRPVFRAGRADCWDSFYWR